MEIERKFLIDSFPDLPEIKSLQVYQGYLATAPAVRISKGIFPDGSERYEMTVKGKGTLVRTEVNIDITAEQYEEMATLLTKEPIHKDYHVYQLPDGHQLECSIVDGHKESGFMYAEVEFDTVEEANAFVPPEYLGREVTEDHSFSMNSYWINGRINICK